MEENKHTAGVSPEIIKGSDNDNVSPETIKGEPTEVKKVDDDAATAEEVEAFIRDRRRTAASDKGHSTSGRMSTTGGSPDDEVDIFGEHLAPENSIDPYLEPDPTLPWVKYGAGKRDRDAQLQQGDFVQLDARHPPARPEAF